MGSYPHVNPGDAFQPSVQEENDIRDLLNATGRDGVRSNRGGLNVENICINAYNPGTEAIPSGTVVIFADAPMIEGAVQIAAMPEEDETAEWAIAQEEIPAHGFGSILVMGAVIVPISGETGDYAVPVGGGAAFERAATGVARILRLIGSTSALILVGSSSGGGGISYVAGDGIDGDLITGGTIAGNYIGGTNVNIVPVQGSTNGQMQIDFSGGGGVAEYDGPFTVTMTGTSVCKVWNPHVNLLAGIIRIGSLPISVSPKTDIPVSWNGHVYVTVEYNTTSRTYLTDFTSTLPTNPDSQPQFWYRELAFVDGYGVAHQSYWGGNIEIEGRWCD